jgi:hypothetical protein
VSDTNEAGDSVNLDIVKPSIVSFSGPAMLLTFNELINEGTINNSTIWYKDAAQVERAFAFSIVTEYTNTGVPISVVHLTPEAGHVTGTLYVKLRQIKDLAGNYGVGLDTSHSF